MDIVYLADRAQTVPKSQVAKVGDDVELVCSKDDMGKEICFHLLNLCDNLFLVVCLKMIS